MKKVLFLMVGLCATAAAFAYLKGKEDGYKKCKDRYEENDCDDFDDFDDCCYCGNCGDCDCDDSCYGCRCGSGDTEEDYTG